LVLLLGTTACGNDTPTTPDANVNGWTIVHEKLPQALMSVWGANTSDVWVVGADIPNDSEGPLVLHWDGAVWTRHATGTTGDLWWVFGFENGPVYMGGKGGQILRYESGGFTVLTTPSIQTVYGIWGSSPDDLWAVGADDGGASGGFVWRLQADTWGVAAGLPVGIDAKAVWKVHGTAANDVWMVGTSGLVLHWNGTAFEEEALGSTSLFTVHCDGARCVAVGGFASDVIFERENGVWQNASTPTDPPMFGVCVTANIGYAVGDLGTMLERGETGWSVLDSPPTSETLHAIWVDPEGGVWSVGGRVRMSPLTTGVLVYRGAHPPTGEIQ